MFMTSLITLICSFALSLILASSPLTLGMWILLLSVLMAMVIAMLTHSWFGMMLFLIYVGGLLVMFAYFAALLPNQLLEISKMTTATMLATAVLFIPMNKMYTSMMKPGTTPNSPAYQMFFYQNLPILFLVGFILLLAMIAVVKISQSYRGPLRPFL